MTWWKHFQIAKTLLYNSHILNCTVIISAFENSFISSLFRQRRLWWPTCHNNSCEKMWIFMNNREIGRKWKLNARLCSSVHCVVDICQNHAPLCENWRLFKLTLKKIMQSLLKIFILLSLIKTFCPCLHCVFYMEQWRHCDSVGFVTSKSSGLAACSEIPEVHL